MTFLRLLEGIRIPGVNEFMLFITRFGEETAFLVAALIVFWCVDKYKGYFLLGAGLFGTLANQFLKIACRVLRPWDLDPSFTILPQAKAGAGGYSFPSGHSQSAVGTFGGIALTTRKSWLKWTCVAICILVPFSRMYVGVHTPKDILVGSLMALATILVFQPLMLGKNKCRWIPAIFFISLLLNIAFMSYVMYWPFPSDLQQHNYDSALKNAFTLLGTLSGVLVVYFADEHKLHFVTSGCWWAQLMKVGFGLMAVLAVKEGLRSPLEAVFCDPLTARAVRYFLIVIVAGILWPLTFRWFSKLGRNRS